MSFSFSQTFYIIFFCILIFLGYFIFENIKTKKKLEEVSKKLNQIYKQKDEFISMAAHELRTPITAIKGYISMVMQGDAGETTDKARGYLSDAISTIERLDRLINNMLNVSRIEEGRMVFQIETLNLTPYVQMVYNQFKVEAERRRITFILHVPREVKDKVSVDPDRILEVIANLVSNAVKYTEKGAIKLSLKQPKENILRFEVSDTGPGISPEEQKRLFRKFYRAESNVGKTIGTGLGLYISKLLVEKFNGKIGVKSQEGVGSTFWFELPVI